MVDKTPSEVFDAINNVSAWWQGQVEGSTKNTDDEFIYRMPGHHYSKQHIAELVPGRKVVWLVSDSELKFNNKSEWTGTRIIFEIDKANGQTQVRFTHEGLVPALECYGGCSWAWQAGAGEPAQLHHDR